jgi:type II secretory pathway pseudopilin PulG
MTSKRIGSHRLYSFRRQKGVSLIPALITICIFTLLATQVVIPNQNRNIRETNINAVASSVEQLIQASYAYRSASASPPSWPTSIGDNTTAGDLVPTYLPSFNNRTPWGDTWTISNAGGFHFRTDTKNQNTAQALVQKIGSYAQIAGSVVQVYPVRSAPPTVDVQDLTVNQDITVRGNIILTGQIRASNGTTVLFDASASNPIAIQSHSHSSKRFKQNIHPLETPIENIYQLKPVTYDYKKAFKQYKTPNAANKEIGLIAEQVMPLIPEITLVEDNKVVGIDYPKLSILLLKAVQELRTKVTSLQRSNQQLQQQINNLTLPSPLHESNMIKTTQ